MDQQQLDKEEDFFSEDGKVIQDYLASPLTPIQRYYTQLFSVEREAKMGGDQYVYLHSNKLCVVGIASTHPLLKEGVVVVSVDFAVTKQSRLDNKVRGAKKKGGIWLDVNSPLCEVTCQDGSKFKIYSSLRGTLLEINRRLIDSPQLLTQKPFTEGHVGIIRPKNDPPEGVAHLFSQSEFEDHKATLQAPSATTSSSNED